LRNERREEEEEEEEEQEEEEVADVDQAANIICEVSHSPLWYCAVAAFMFTVGGIRNCFFTWPWERL